MDEESRRERILQGASDAGPQRKAGSKGCREGSAEARLVWEGTTALESEGIALPAGFKASHKNWGWAKRARFLTQSPWGGILNYGSVG
jgi:hypothetical protein